MNAMKNHRPRPSACKCAPAFSTCCGLRTPAGAQPLAAWNMVDAAACRETLPELLLICGLLRALVAIPAANHEMPPARLSINKSTCGAT
eukprot:6302195-Pyramimonas_sp.AAC.1